MYLRHIMYLAEKMPSILDDSEDFIADTPPFQLRKQKWREDNSNDDSKVSIIFEWESAQLDNTFIRKIQFGFNSPIKHNIKSLYFMIGIRCPISGFCK